MLIHKKGALGAVRGNDTTKASHGIQFYIVHGKINGDKRLNKIQKYKNRDNAIEYYKNDTTKKTLLDSIRHYEDKENRDRYNELTDSILSLAKTNNNFKKYSIPKVNREVYKTIGGTPYLDLEYTVFGEVIVVLNVIDSIATVATNSDDKPLKNVRIISMKFLK